MNDSGNRWMDDLTNVFSAAAKTNAELMKQGIELWKGTLIQPSELSRILTEGSFIVTRGFVDYVRLNAEHAQRMIELGRTFSNDLLASFNTTGEVSKSPVGERPETGQTVNELHVNGKPGDLCRSAFVLESRKSATVTARVRNSRFVNTTDNCVVSIPLVIDPPEKSVAPGERARFTVEAGIPEEMPAGSYQAMVWIDGFPELSLRVLLSVLRETAEAQPANAKRAKDVQMTSKRSKQHRKKRS